MIFECVNIKFFIFHVFSILASFKMNNSASEKIYIVFHETKKDLEIVFRRIIPIK